MCYHTPMTDASPTREPTVFSNPISARYSPRTTSIQSIYNPSIDSISGFIESPITQSPTIQSIKNPATPHRQMWTHSRSHYEHSLGFTQAVESSIGFDLTQTPTRFSEYLMPANAIDPGFPSANWMQEDDFDTVFNVATS